MRVIFSTFPSFFMSCKLNPRSKSWREYCGGDWILLRSWLFSTQTSCALMIVSMMMRCFSSGRFSVGSI